MRHDKSDSPHSEERTLPPDGPVDDDATLPPTEQGKDLDTLAPQPESAWRVGGSIQYFGDYELIDEIARGGMGVVYRARQTSLNRVVALKMILSGQLAGEEEVLRFQTEAQAAANLDHPGIVPIYEVGEVEGQHYFSMGFVDGESLAAKVSEGPMPPREAAELIRAISDAIAHAHSRGVIHRDLKPGNVLVDVEGVPKVTDFGLAKRVEGDSDLTASGQILGTPAYMPPEQAAGKIAEVTQGSDIYSLGGILYALLTGRPPFQAENHLDTLMQVLEKEPLAPSQLVPGIPRDLETICLTSLEKDPNRRYSSAEALSQDLHRFLNGEPIVARPVSRAERVWRWCRRKPVAASLIATAILLLLTLGIGGPYIAIQQVEFAKRQIEFRQVADAARQDAEEKRREADEAKTLAIAAQQEEEQQRERAEAETRKAELAQQSAVKAREEAEAERDAKGIALTRAEGLALCAQSNAVRKTHPSLALLLAIESVKRRPTSVTFANLYAAREACHEILTLVGHAGNVRDAVFSHDGGRIATVASDDISVRVWDSGSGEQVFKAELVPQVLSVALSPDGKRVAVTTEGSTHYKAQPNPAPSNRIAELFQKFMRDSNDREVDETEILYTDRVCRVWDTETRAELFRLNTHRDRVTDIEFTADGKHIVTCSWDQTVRLWDAATGKELKVWKNFDDRPLTAISCSLDGRSILVLPDLDPRHTNYPMDLIDGLDKVDPDAPIESGTAYSIYYHVDKQEIPSVDQPAIAYLIDVEADQVEALRRPGSELEATCCCLSADGQQLALAFANGIIELWDITAFDAPKKQFLGNPAAIRCVAFSDDGKLLATGGEDRKLRIWNIETGKQEKLLRGHTGPVRSVCFGTAGRVVSAGGRTARVWDLVDVQPLARPLSGHGGHVVSIEFSPSGDRIVTASHDGSVRVWNADTAERVLNLDNEKLRSKPVFARFSPNGKQVLTSVAARDPLRVWDAKSGKELLSFKDDRGVADATYSPDGKMLVTVSDEHVRTERDWSAGTNRGYTCIWDSESAARVLDLPVPAPIGLVPEISPDSRWMVGTHREDATSAHIFEIQTHKHRLTLSGHEGAIRDLAIDPQRDQVLTASSDNTARLWDAASGKQLARLTGFGGDVTLCEYSSDGSLFVTVVDSRAFVWNAETLEVIGTLIGHEAPIMKVRFTPDRKHLFTVSMDQTAAFWEVESSRMLLLFQAFIGDEVTAADINSDGTLVATGSSDGAVRLWPVNVWPTIEQRLPRKLTPEELRRYDLVTPQERRLKKSSSMPTADPN